MTAIKFEKKTPFIKEMEEKVSNYFATKNISKFGNTKLYLKTIFWLSLMIVLYSYLVFFTPNKTTSIFLCVALGISFACIGFNIMHDAAHGSYSRHTWINTVFSHSLDILGASSLVWKVKHNITHHTYTNIHEYDDDIETSPALRLHKDQIWHWWYVFQPIYMWILYSLEYVGWVTLFDFQKFFHKKVGKNKIVMSQKDKWFFFLFTKGLYLCIFIGIPCYFVGPIPALTGYAIVSVMCGLVISIVFQLAHIQEKSAFPEIREYEHPDYFKHQLKTTANFATANPIVSWMLGGLNFQIEHHLFPRISHVHYPKIREIVKDVCKKHEIPYNEYKTLVGALISHVRYIFKLSIAS